MPSQAYFDGDWYECIATAAPGESPTTHPAKWQKLPMPQAFASSVVTGALAILHKGEGQSDKASRELAHAEDLLSRAALRHRDKGDFDTSTVMTR